MSPREPAERQLERVLHVLPIAARPAGASLSELAAELGVPEERLLRDIGEVTARADYLEPPVDIDILIEEDRVTVWTTAEFRRPVKLSPREAEILGCLREGAPNKIIARKFDVTEATVKVHVKAILRKVGAANRTQAAMWASQRLPQQGGASVNG